MSRRFILLVLIIGTNAQYHHEGDYWATLDRSDIVQYNRSYIQNLTYYIGFFNRTLKTVNGQATLIRNLSEDLTEEIQAYKFMSNEYRFFPITLKLHLCEEYKKNTFGARDMLDKYSNFRSCPPKPGTYYMRNALLDFSAFPPLIPAGQYQLVHKFFHKSDLMCELNGFYTVTEFLKKRRG